MADVKWIKIVTNIFDDEKMKLIEGMPDHDAIIVIWFKLLCMAGKQNNGGVLMMNDRVAYTDEMLATIFRRPLTTVRLALSTFEDFGMIEIINNAITIPNWEKHQTLDKLAEAKEKNRLRVAAHRERQKALASGNDYCNVTVTQCNALDKEEDKIIDKTIRKESIKKEKTHTLFERLLPEYNIPELLQSKMREWLTYKTERKESYTEVGMKALLRKVENNQLNYSEQAVCTLIDDCMANNWKGIIFDRLAEKPKTKANPTQPNPKQRYGDFDPDEAFKLALERSGRSEPPLTVADSEELRERAEALKNKISQSS